MLPAGIKQARKEKMPNNKYPFLNFQVDHMAMHAEKDLYSTAYLFYRIIFGASKEDILYTKNVKWQNSDEESMTYAVRIGKGPIGPKELQNTVIAMIQPSEPENQPSHVRNNLRSHNAACLWMHIAIRTPDLLSFHKYATERGVNFITPIMTDADEDLIQVFSGEWYLPGGKPSGTFFEFVQRDVNEALIKKVDEHNRETWFRDTTFLGLYQEKEREYESGIVTPFIDHELFEQIHSIIKNKKFWEINEEDVVKAENIMINYISHKNQK